MNTPNEIESIGEINILEKQNEDTTKKLNKKSGEAGGKGASLINAKTDVYFLNKKVNAMKAIIIGGKVETMIRALAKEENTVVVYYNAFEGTYISKKGLESKCYYSTYGAYSGAVMKNSKPPVLKCYIKYNDDDWKWNDEGYLYYDGEDMIDYKDKTTPIIKGTKFV